MQEGPPNKFCSLRWLCLSVENPMDTWIRRMQWVVAVATSLVFLWTAFFGAFEAVIQRSLLLLAALLWVFLEFSKQTKYIIGKLVYLVVGLVASGVCLYLVFFWPDIVKRFGIPLRYEYVLGGVLVLILLYVGKRLIGWAFPLIVVCFLVYALFGPYMPGILAHKGVTVERLLASIYLTTQGLWGTVMHVASTTIIQFVIFGTFLRLWGAGDFFMNLTSAMVGSVRGGPAKMAVVSSGLTGMISGVATANVATTGSITIPLMKRTGYPPAFAGAVEAAASTGGQILPPVMGASVFIVAETLGVPIWEVMKAAFIPALLFYFGVFMAVDFRAAKMKLRGVSKDELPNLKETLKSGWLYFVPIAVLVLAVYLQYSPGRAAFLAIVALLIVGMFIRDAKPSIRKFFEAFGRGRCGRHGSHHHRLCPGRDGRRRFEHDRTGRGFRQLFDFDVGR